MDKRITSSAIKDDHVSRETLELLEEAEKELELIDGIAYYDFPLFQDETEGSIRTQILYISKSNGVIAIECLNYSMQNNEYIEESKHRLEQLDSLLFSKILRSRILRKNKREIKISLDTLVMCKGLIRNATDEIDKDVITNKEALKERLLSNQTEILTTKEWDELRSIIEGGKGIFKVVERNTKNFNPDKKIHALAKLESEIANFDRDQRLAAITYTQGPQRIRGLAGSGKTIVLAMKVARLHLEEPDKKILFTFWTKSLYEVIRNLISRFYRQFSDSDVNWENIDVLHGWGGRNLPGVYYASCVDNGFSPYSLRDVPSHIKHRFSYICELALRHGVSPKYDHIIIDEGQDFPPSFFQLCFELTKGPDIDRNIVWAFDELQTIMEAETQDLVATFGRTDSGTAKIDIARAAELFSGNLLPHDIILRKCYRNPREILIAAHSLGFGIHDQMVQNLENKDHWEVVGYRLINGDCTVGKKVTFERPKENSPLSISSHPSAGKLIEHSYYENIEDEISYVCQEIEKFLSEGIDLHDMLIVCLDDRNFKEYSIRFANTLNDKGIILNNIKTSNYSVPKFFIENQITISTVYSAKGNEAPVVFLVGIDAIHPIRHTKRGRNRLFTAITRSKAWLRVSGIGSAANHFCNELELAEKDFPNLIFEWPDKEKIQTILNDINQRSKQLLDIKQKILDLGITELTQTEIESFTSPKGYK